MCHQPSKVLKSHEAREDPSGSESRQTRTRPYSEAAPRGWKAGRMSLRQEDNGDKLVQRDKVTTLPVLARTLYTCGVGEWARVQGHWGRPRVGRDAGGLGAGGRACELLREPRRSPH